MASVHTHTVTEMSNPSSNHPTP